MYLPTSKHSYEQLLNVLLNMIANQLPDQQYDTLSPGLDCWRVWMLQVVKHVVKNTRHGVFATHCKEPSCIRTGLLWD